MQSLIFHLGKLCLKNENVSKRKSKYERLDFSKFGLFYQTIKLQLKTNIEKEKDVKKDYDFIYELINGINNVALVSLDKSVLDYLTT